MIFRLCDAGAANLELVTKAHGWWHSAAIKNNVNLEGFDPDAAYGDRIAWALQAQLLVATIYSRYSSKLQHSTDDQVRECIEWAARHGIYVPPELICIDEAVKGKSVRREGLERMKQILRTGNASVLLVFKVSRLFRQAFKGFQLIQEEVVEQNLRAVSVSQGIDTNDTKTWKLQIQIHGIMDDALLDGIADHVRAGLTGLHQKGWTTGAIGVGFRRKELPGGPITNRGLPRTVPEIDPEAAELIRKHARLHLDGMSLKEGWRRWLAEGGPCDPRSTLGRMSYNAYRRLWGNVRLTGRWEFGRKRNQFFTKLDYVRQIEQPDSSVSTFVHDDLRILDDETFLALQAWLQPLKTGPRGPRKQTQLQLWDLTTEMFHCVHCSQPDVPVRYYQTGANGKAMQCKKGDLCIIKSAVNREKAVRAICEKLAELIGRDADLIEQTICRSRERNVQGDGDVQREILALENAVRTHTRRINDLYDLVGSGSDEDRKEVRSQLHSAQAKRSAAQLKLTALKKPNDELVAALTSDDIRRILKETTTLLLDAAAGKFGDEAVYKALAVFRRLTGGRIWVHVERRKGRKRTNVRGVFTPHLIRAVGNQAEPTDVHEPAGEEVSVWLREPPRMDAIAERVHELIDLERLSHRDTAKRLWKEGHNVNSGNVWYSYRRWYEMNGQTPPPLPYNNGHRRKPA
ncbi:MAG: recombinase family protein [Planctomycetales bacterium]|nr:recombinase family protein [Planctomycetales bacterium]